VKVNNAKFARLTAAAEHYEALCAAGELRGDAFRLAMRPLRYDGRRTIPAVISRPLAALVEGYVLMLVGANDCHEVLQEMRGGSSRLSYYTRIRDEIAWRARRVGYHPKAIGAVLGRDRTTIIDAIARFEARLATDEVLRARVERTTVRREGAAA